MQVLLTLPLVLLALYSAPLSYAEESHPGMNAESMYSEAVLAFNKKQTKQAIQILDQILAQSPNHLEALELKALSLKTMGDDKQAVTAYEKLLQTKPPKERGPYHFELGALYNKNKQFDAAKVQFERSIELGFNETVSHLFLGMITFTKGDINSAQKHFTEIRGGTSAEFKAVAAYYLGMIHFKNGNGNAGTSEMMAARTFAADAKDSKLAQDIKGAASKVLAPFDTAQTFASVTVLANTDSNITQVPSGSGTSSVSNSSANNLSFNGGLGYMTAPGSATQGVFSYRLAFNRLTDSKLRSYEFATNTPSIYVNFSPLSQTSGGIKIEGTFMFQNGGDTANSSSSFSYGKYMGAGEFGPFIKTEVAPGWNGQLEATAKSQTFYQNSDLNGTLYGSKLSLKGNSGSTYWNPTFSLTYEQNQAQGADWRNRNIEFVLLDTARLSTADTLTLTLDYSSISYPDNSAQRADSNLASRVSFIHNLAAKWSVLADFGYTKNSSSLDSVYSYSRWTASAGIGWTL